MYPFGGLPENLIAFCAFLRREHRFSIGPGEVRDAARALEVVDLAKEREVRNALRPTLARSLDDVRAFDEAFSRFFFPGPRGVPQPELPAERRALVPPAGGEDGAARKRSTGQKPHEIDGEGDVDAATTPAAPTDAAPEETAARLSLVRARYSPLQADAPPQPPEVTRVEAAWRDAARVLVRRLRFGLSRRWRPAPAGRRFDLRRTLRASVQTGGETLTVRWLQRPTRAPRFVLLVDGSRSMAGSAPAALQVAVAVATVTMRVEVFTFSTGLRCVTGEVRRAAAGETLSLDDLQYAWGGGTTIGACLREFLRRFGDRLLGRHTLVVIASDGLDVGGIDVLRDAMREIRRRSAGVVWLNPLLGTAGYEPTARGMAAARPYITTFASVGTASDLARLAHTIRART